jgi:hypothetical protein
LLAVAALAPPRGCHASEDRTARTASATGPFVKKTQTKKKKKEENRGWKKTMGGRGWKKTQPEEDPAKKTRLSNRLIYPTFRTAATADAIPSDIQSIRRWFYS